MIKYETFRKKINNFQSWLSYTLSKTSFDFQQYSRNDFPADHDQRHSVKLTNQWSFRNFSTSLGIKYSSGLPYTTIESFEINNSQQGNDNEIDADYSRINAFRLEPLLEINLGFNYRIELSNSRLNLSLAFVNFTDNNNIYNRTYYIEALQDQTPQIDFTNKSSLPFTPDFSLRYEF